MIGITSIKKGSKIIYQNEPFEVIYEQHSKTGRAGAVLRSKLRNLITGAVINKTFQGSEKVEPLEIENRKAQFLYAENKLYYFMDSENFEQFELSQEVLGDSIEFLKEGSELDVFYFKDQPVNINLPIKMSFEVVEAPPGVKGNTADGGSKQVVIETGAKINTPLFIKTGDVIQVNTETREYAGKFNG
jgi:elongation factor P